MIIKNVRHDLGKFNANFSTLKVFGLRDGHNINPIQYFDAVLKTNNRNIEALFGKAKVSAFLRKMQNGDGLASSVTYQLITPLT